MWSVLAGKTFPVLGAVSHSAVSAWYEVPQVNECYFVLRCINDTRLSRLVGTSGGLNNLRCGGATQVDPGFHNAWLCESDWRMRECLELQNIVCDGCVINKLY